MSTPPSGFEIDGVRYEIPKLDTITLDEERVMYLYADTVLQDFMPAYPNDSEEEKRAYEALQARKIRNPEFKRALAHIAYRREHPDVVDSVIHDLMGPVSALEVDLAMLRSDDESPPVRSSQKQPETPSETSERSPSGDSGRPTTTASAPVDDQPEPTGTTESDTSSPGAAPIALAR